MENHATAAGDDPGPILAASADPEFGLGSKLADAAGPSILQRAPSFVGVRNLAYVLVIVATSLYLLEQLEPVLRPLLIAVLLCYLFLPLYNRLRRRMRPVLAFLFIAAGFTLGILLLTRMVYRDVVEIDSRLPVYRQREAVLERKVRELTSAFTPQSRKAARAAPGTPAPAQVDAGRAIQAGADEAAEGELEAAAHLEQVEPEDSLTSELSQRLVRGAASAFVSISLESIVVAFYMIFLLQSASRLPGRIASSFSSERARGIMEVVESSNHAISEYLAVKVKASLLVAVPVGLLCWGFGITGAVTWGVFAFFGNFLPYIGPLIAFVPPAALAFLEFDSLGPPTVFTLLLLAINGITSNVIEPAMTGKALGLSPLIVLIGLAFWSLLWGLVGMVLAVPLTVIFKIVLEHTPATRPIARLISDDE
jgi:predicted PurR-regulated permease PerM